MTQLRRWLEEMQQGQLGLDELSARIEQRGRLDPALYQREQDDLDALLRAGAVDPPLHQALSTRLAQLQQAAASDDVTRVSTTGRADSSPLFVDDDRTLRAPVAAPALSQTAATSQGSGASSSGDRSSSWKRLSEAGAPGVTVDVGSRLKDRFVLEKKLGQGGMGVVYLALDERKLEARDRNPRVAVKVLNDEFRRHPDSLIALQRESRRTQQLAHDNIVRVYDFDKDGTIVFMTMEYVEGEDLEALIRNLQGKGLPMAQAYPIIEGMARALERAHREGVVHSDFKPGNVMLTKDRVAKVFDFGIARAGKQGGAGGEQTVFDAGKLGALTPAYASLEMLYGGDAEPADDLYALACVAYELLSGTHPFKKLNAGQAHAQELAPTRIPGLSTLQWRTLCRGLAFQRKDRIASAAELVEGLRPRTQRERSLPLVLAGIAMLALAALLIWGGMTFWYQRKLANVEACIGSAACADATVLMQRLDRIDPADQMRISESHRDPIKGIFHSSLAQHWAPQQGRYDHRAAADVVKLAFGLYGADSAWVKELGQGLEAGRNTTLSLLNDEFTRQIEQDPFARSTGTERGLLAILDAVRAIDPAQPLLHDGRIVPALERGVRSALTDPRSTPAQQLETAKQRLDIAQRYAGESQALMPLAADLAARDEQVDTTAREEQRSAAARTEREQRLAAVAQALDQAAATSQWRSRLRDAWLAARAAAPANDPDLLKLGRQMSAALLAQSTTAQNGGDLEAASEWTRLGLELLPGNADLQRQLSQLDQARDRRIAQAQTEVERSRMQQDRLDQLLRRPSPTVQWIDEVDATLKAVAGSVDPAKAQSQRETFARSIDQRVTQAVAASDFDTAQSLADRAAASSMGAQLAGLPERVNAARRQTLAKQIEKLRELVREKTFTAEWQKSVEAAIAALRTVSDPGVPALLESLAAAYAERADKLAGEKSYGAARQLGETGARLVPRSTAIQAAMARITELEQADLAAGARQQQQFRIEELERTVALKAAASELNEAIAALEQLRKLDASNRFAASDGPQQIADGALKLAERFAAAKDFANAMKAADRGLHVQPDSTALIQARGRYETAGRPATAVAPTPAIAQPSAPTPEIRVTAAGPDPCRRGFAGDGIRQRAQCTDDAGGVKGPIVVVVSGLGTFGITMTEVWYAEFARYCQRTGPCPPAPTDGFLPVTNISIDQARGYARWLSSVTGRRYRLPNAGEWKHAASVGGRDVFGEGFCKRESAGSGPRQITAGEMNGWGLVNSVGNVWELVDDGSSVSALGGGFLDDSRSCAADARRAYAGPDPATGFRLVRELDP